MNIKKSTTKDSIIYTLSGKFTFSDHQMFRAVIDSIRNGESSNYVLELADLEFVDSAALGMFLVAREETKKKNFNLTLSNPAGHVLKMFTLSNFTSLFNII
jgi:HptB-dependent secretion and biofilm anti anti-sigma factor